MHYCQQSHVIFLSLTDETNWFHWITFLGYLCGVFMDEKLKKLIESLEEIEGSLDFNSTILYLLEFKNDFQLKRGS